MGKFGLSLLQGAASEAASGFVSGLGNAVFGGISARRNWKYKQKEMKLQQQYALEQMQQQFDYQQQAWDAENRYNDPTNVAARYRQAGVNPLAALGGGSAGIANSMATPSTPSGPSAGDYGSDAAPNYAAAGQAMVQNSQVKLAESQAKVNEAQARKLDSEAEGNENYNSIFHDVIKQGLELDNRNKAWNNFLLSIQAEWARVNAALDTKAKIKGLQKIDKDMEEIDSRINLNNSNKTFIDETLRPTVAKLWSEVNDNNASAKEHIESASLKYEQAATEWYKREILGTYDAEKDLIDARSAEALKRAEEMDEHINLMVKKGLLADQQARYVRHAVAQAWVNTGVNVARSVSSELRQWISFVKGQGSGASGLISSASWSDVAAAAEDAKIAELMLAM
ncbi:DNA pilot protein [Dipodfec virus UOA04_Rod_542]|nr:DNA pilot protein [Dipodfec virus UOA04_Rod_542]